LTEINGRTIEALEKDMRHGLAEPNLLPWLFAQKRGKPMVAFDKIAGPKDRRPTSLEK
jgi:hypothetical protein